MELWRRVYIYVAVLLLIVVTVDFQRKQKFDNVLKLDAEGAA